MGSQDLGEEKRGSMERGRGRGDFSLFLGRDVVLKLAPVLGAV